MDSDLTGPLPEAITGTLETLENYQRLIRTSGWASIPTVV